MAYTTTNIFVRPNTSINWYVQSSDVHNHIKTIDDQRTNNSLTVTESADGLTLKHVSVFVNKAAFTAFMEDSVMTTFINTRTTYNRNNGIIRSFSFEES